MEDFQDSNSARNPLIGGLHKLEEVASHVEEMESHHDKEPVSPIKIKTQN